MTKCHFTPGSEYWPLIGWCWLTTDLWLVDNSRCSHPGSELDHQRVWSLCWGHHLHLGHLLGHLLGSPETGGMKTNMNSNQTPLVHGKSVCEEIWKKRTRIFSNDTDIQLKVSQVFNSLNFTPWTHYLDDAVLQIPYLLLQTKLQNVWTEHYWMRTKGECGFAKLGADPAMISNWNRSILNSAIDDHWSHTERIVQVLVNFIHLLIR